MQNLHEQNRHSIIKCWIHFIAISIIVFTGLYAEPIDKTNDVRSPSTKTITKDTNQQLDSIADTEDKIGLAEAANELALSENESDMVKEIDEIPPIQDLTKLQTEQNTEKAEYDDVLSDEAIEKIDATVDSWNPKKAIANHPRLKGKDIDKIKVEFFLKKLSDINPNDNKFTAQFHVIYNLPLARSYLNTQSEILALEKQKDLTQLNNVLQHITNDARELSDKHPGLYTLISKYLKKDHITFDDIKHAMTQHEGIELELYYLAMNLPVDATSGNPIPGRLIEDDFIYDDVDHYGNNTKEDHTGGDMLDAFGAPIENSAWRPLEEDNENLNDEDDYGYNSEYTGDNPDNELYGLASDDISKLNREDNNAKYLSRAQYICHKYNQNQSRGIDGNGLCDVMAIQEKK